MSMTRKIFNLFFEEAWKYKFRVMFSVTNSALTVLVSSFLSPLIIASFLNKIQNGETITLSGSWTLIILYGLAQIYSQIIGVRLTIYSTWTFETHVDRNILKRVFTTLSNQTMKFHADRFGGSLVSQTNKLVSSSDRFWDTIINQVVPLIVGLTAATVILAFIFWQYALVLAILSIIFIFVIIYGSRFMAKLNIEEAQASTKNTGRLADVVSNIMAVKSHGHEDFEIKEYDKRLGIWQEKSFNTMWGFLKISSFYSTLIVIINMSAIILAIWATEQNMINVAQIYLALTYTITITRQLWDVNGIMRSYHRVMGDAYDMVEILNLPNDIVDTDAAKKTSFSRGTISFDDVNFSHDGTTKLFKNLSIHIKPGEKVGLVGHSGSGKTTLTKLLLRFMDIQSGAIRIDGQDISKLKQSEFRSHISYVPQEPVLFHRTLKDNIGYGQFGSDMRAIKGAAKLAHADEFIKVLPDGYDTLVGERGVKLSGGQRQRIAIARAMLKNAPILVLDEATSALDSESEELIQDALWKLMEGRTAIVIAHRLSTIQKMDRILVMDNGKVVEEGTHKELIRQKGVYARLWQKQSGGFLEE